MEGSVTMTMYVQGEFKEELNDREGEMFQSMSRTWCDMVRITVVVNPNQCK